MELFFVLFSDSLRAYNMYNTGGPAPSDFRFGLKFCGDVHFTSGLW